MNIKNYTSSVSAEKSIADIEKILIHMGATNIAKQYINGKIESISFSIKVGDSHVPYRLPGRVEPIKKLFISSLKRRPTNIQTEQARIQAERTAWKNVKEWVELQATMIKLEQVEFMEVFMPYMYSFEKDQTFYQISKANGFKQLTA